MMYVYNVIMFTTCLDFGSNIEKFRCYCRGLVAAAMASVNVHCNFVCVGENESYVITACDL